MVLRSVSTGKRLGSFGLEGGRLVASDAEVERMVRAGFEGLSDAELVERFDGGWSNGYLVVEPEGGSLKHQLGLHDQSTHGRRGSSAGRSSRRKPPKAAGAAERLRSGIASGIAEERKISTEHNMNDVYLVRFNDGSSAVVKKSKGTGEEVKAEFDAEELGAHVARVLGLTPPHVHRESEDEVFFSYLHDTAPGARVGAEVGVSAVDLTGRDARRIGLLDTLIENTDRNSGNWFTERPDDPDAPLIPIDHGQGWEPARSGFEPDEIPYPNPFQRYLIQHSPRSAWVDNDLSPAYLAKLRPKLEALRPEFDRLGRGEWLDRALVRLDIVTAHAKGAVAL